MKSPRKAQTRRLQYEHLEPREMMVAGIMAALNPQGVLNVIGTDTDDQLRFRQSSDRISIDGVNGSWAANRVTSIAVELGIGNDFVSFDSIANGGQQKLKEKVTIRSGGGDEHVRLANLRDVYFSGLGQTLEVATTGAAKLNGVRLNLSNSPIRDAGHALNVTPDGTATPDGQVVNLDEPATSDAALLFNLTPAPDEGSATATSALLGDYDGSGTVDSGDYILYRMTFGQTGPGLAADGNSNNQVDVGDYDIWRAHYGETAATGNWFDANIQDVALRSLGSSLYADSLINRSDIMSLFQSAQDGATVDATEFSDLQAIVGNTSLFGTLDYVWKLSSYIVNGNAANANYQGQALGNLTAGSTATKLANLVNKWFLGLDRPAASGTYRQIAGTLFVNGTSYTDVKQGAAADCYYMAALAEFAQHDPTGVANMFVVNGDGTYTVRFYNSGVAEYVTVDSYLPTSTASGYLIYASPNLFCNNPANELWGALAEKAFAQLNEMGWARLGGPGNGVNSYAGIYGGGIGGSLRVVTGLLTSYAMTTSPTGFTTFVTAYNAGEMIGFASKVTPPSTNIIGSHFYTVVSYSSTNQTLTLYNPWGSEGLITMTWSQMQANFDGFNWTA